MELEDGDRHEGLIGRPILGWLPFKDNHLKWKEELKFTTEGADGRDFQLLCELDHYIHKILPKSSSNLLGRWQCVHRAERPARLVAPVWKIS